MVFPSYLKFCTHLVVLVFKPIQWLMFSYFLEKYYHMMISIQTSNTLVISKLLGTTIYDIINCWQTKAPFWLTIKQSSYSTIGLCSNRIYNIFIFEKSFKDHIQNVSYQINLLVISCTLSLLNWSIDWTNLLFIINSF